MQIVVVEDNPADVILVREALERHSVHCTVTVISDGETALRFIDEVDLGLHDRPHLVILDLNLPKKPGKEIFRGIRASTSCSHIPVVVLTSSDNLKDKEEVAALGPSRYIRKPFTLDEFMALGALFKQIASEHL